MAMLAISMLLCGYCACVWYIEECIKFLSTLLIRCENGNASNVLLREYYTRTERELYIERYCTLYRVLREAGLRLVLNHKKGCPYTLVGDGVTVTNNSKNNLLLGLVYHIHKRL